MLQQTFFFFMFMHLCDSNLCQVCHYPTRKKNHVNINLQALNLKWLGSKLDIVVKTVLEPQKFEIDSEEPNLRLWCRQS